MSLLEDFKRYAAREIDGGVTHRDNEPVCACVVLPRVIAALEAAERVRRAFAAKEAFSGVYLTPADPGDYWDRDRAVEAEVKAAHEALVAALRGEGVTA